MLKNYLIVAWRNIVRSKAYSALNVLGLAVGLAVFTFVLLVARLLKLIELVVSRGLPLAGILRLFSYIMPAFLEVTVPMAMLLAILIGSLARDAAATGAPLPGDGPKQANSAPHT